MGRVIKGLNARILAAASVVGREERRGPLGDLFDAHDDSGKFGAATFEQAEGEMVRHTVNLLLKKWGGGTPDVFLGGDLQNQCTASALGLHPFGVPYLGLYGACSTATEGLLLSSLLVSAGYVTHAVSVTSSHNAAAERQFRLPLEYGGQRTPTAQWTATAAGAFVLGKEGRGVRVEAVMVGRMVDGGISDAANMGAAMAPAAADSILSFLSETGAAASDFDAIVTGDLGEEGSALLSMLCEREGVRLSNHLDCGCLLYDSKRQDVHAGGSGCGCSASVLASYFLPRLREGRLARILFLSTGALMSPTSIQQGKSILGVAPVLLLSGK